MVNPTEKENSLTARNGGPRWPEDHYLSPFVQRRREMAHPVLAKGFLQLSPEAGAPTSPCPVLSAGAEPKSQRHCQK